MARPRKNRDQSSREAQMRQISEFDKQSIYHIPEGLKPDNEYWYWATMSVRGEPATAHMAQLAMSGYTTVPADKYPQITGASLLKTPNPDNLVTRGASVLVSIPMSKYREIERRRRARTAAQAEAVRPAMDGGGPPIVVDGDKVTREHVQHQIKG